LVDNSSAEPAIGGEETTETEAAAKLLPQRSYSYDKNGNEISVKEYSPALSDTSNSPELTAERINTYDPANRLSSLTEEKNGETIFIQENEYNGNGQRIKKTERQCSVGTPVPTAGTGNSKEEAKNYYYQAGQVLYTENQAASNAAKISAFNMLGISDNIIATERRTTNSKVPRVYYFYNKDLRASTTSIIAESGAAVKAYKYDEFGNTESFGNLDNEIAYTGGIYDKNTQLYYLNARYYNPEDGRFITQDSYRGSKEDSGTWHLYTYCGNNPVNYVDPSGHFAIALPALTGIVIVEAAIKTAVIVGTIAFAGYVYDKFKYYRGGDKCKVKLEVDRPNNINGKTGMSAMKLHWKYTKGQTTKAKLKKFLPRRYHYKRYHLHARFIKSGRT
ncbi:MAG: RHS repeat-associated core domain-containing protein, partial [Anaerovoracaceae bacterium]